MEKIYRVKLNKNGAPNFATAEEIPQGEWKSVKASIYPYGYDVEWSICGHRMGSSFGYKFCPMCGCWIEGNRR